MLASWCVEVLTRSPARGRVLVQVPETADKDSIDASMENGVLTVRINKSEQAEQETTIQIK